MVQPEAYLKISKKVDDHIEEITYHYTDLAKAANIFCDIIKSQIDFIQITVHFGSCPEIGILNIINNVTETIYIKGNQYNNKSDIISNIWGFSVDWFIPKEESYVKIKLAALKIVKEAKKLEKMWKV